jgi:hypothetical protein
MAWLDCATCEEEGAPLERDAGCAGSGDGCTVSTGDSEPVGEALCGCSVPTVDAGEVVGCALGCAAAGWLASGCEEPLDADGSAELCRSACEEGVVGPWLPALGVLLAVALGSLPAAEVAEPLSGLCG